MTGKQQFLYQWHSRAFLARAREHLNRFDVKDDVASLFYAALELRFAIEARLWEYLNAALKTLGKESHDLKEYAASKLLKRLVGTDPDAGAECSVAIASEDPDGGVLSRYTPVTPELAAQHGKLGDLLHYNFFLNNQKWYFKRSSEGKGGRSLVDYRKFLGVVERRLAEATSGTLLAPPHFVGAVRTLLDEAVSDPSHTETSIE